MTPAPKRIFLVEDEMMVAMLVEDLLAELGHRVTASAAHLDEALELARAGEFDVAILDLNLGGQRSLPVAEVLAERAIPFMFASGYGAGGLPPEHSQAVVLQKPFAVQDLAAALDRLQIV
ncbi:MAG: response regulator [Pseudomonadota bacterium]|nr:response regulator [Pseudomonadota bacterium]